MAIENIPQIIASNSGGGIVYSIDFQKQFSSEPSKVTYKVVNSSGTYSLPQIESEASISFGGFSFSGYVYSYELDESVSGKVLSITLIDKSVVLDKKYITVFRRGLLGFDGTKKTITIPVKFDSTDEYYIIQNSQLVKKNFTNGSVTRDVYGGNKTIGDIIIVGEEETAETRCEIPSSSYTFDQLKAAVGSSVSGFSSCPISDSKVKQTYEGSVRSVLNSWCQDFGYSFYWDYSANTLRFFDAKSPVFSIPTSVSDKKIISKRSSKSAEGKYNQIAVNYFAKPYNPKTASASSSKTSYSTKQLSCYNVSYFIDKSLSENSSTIYGGGRDLDEFIISAALGYVSPMLRKIYNYSWMGIWGSNIGFSGQKALAASKAAVALETAGSSDDVAFMVEYSGSAKEDLDTYYYAILARYDQGTEEAWSNLEQEIFTQKIGNFYRCPNNKSGESIFCTATMIIKTSIDYEPEGTIVEDADNIEDKNLVGRKVFSRGAPGPDVNGIEALKTLKLADNASGTPLNPLLPQMAPVSASNALGKALAEQKITVAGYDVLMIIPKPELVSTKLKFSVSKATGSNKKESTYNDVDGSANNSSLPQCTLKDPNEDKCLSQKEELKSAQKKQAEASQNYQQQKPTAGLMGKYPCDGATIGANGASVKILSSSKANYRCVITNSYSVEAILDITELSKFTSDTSGSTSSSKKITQTRLIVENRTTAENISKQKAPTASELATRKGYEQNNDLEKVSYSCAGFVGALPLGVTSGLESLDMSISDSGFSASYSYSTRPPVFLAQDTSIINVGSSSSVPAVQVR